MSGNSYVQPSKTYLTTKPNLIKQTTGAGGHGMACIYMQYERKLRKNDKFNTDLTRTTSRNVNESPKIFPINK